MPRIPNSILRDLKCGHCANWLSCGPVHVLPHGNSICGRCDDIAIPKYRHFAYEALAQIFLYPCMNHANHCPVLLKWNEAVDHEYGCSYRSFCNTLCSHPTVLLKPPNKLWVEQVETYEYIPDAILDPHLKCSVCECYLSCAPVFVRPDGRSICHRCITANGQPKDGSIRHFSYERLAEKMLFPCIYRYRGCTQHFRFGRDIWNHESDCSYGQMYRKHSKLKKGQKERGVIETHSGHVYGTITPNSFQLFAPPKPSNSPAMSQQSNEETQFVHELRKRQEMFSDGRPRLPNEMNPRNSATSLDQEKFPSRSSTPTRAIPNTHNFRTPQADPPSLLPSRDFQRNALEIHPRSSFNAKIPISSDVNEKKPFHPQINLGRSDSLYSNAENNQLVIKELRSRQKLQKSCLDRENDAMKMHPSTPPVIEDVGKGKQNFSNAAWKHNGY